MVQDMIHKITDERSYALAIESEEYLSVVIFLHRRRCSCKRIRYEMESVSEYFTRTGICVRFYTVDVEDPKLADIVDEYEVEYTPVTVFIYGTDRVGTVQGFKNKIEIIDMVYDTLIKLKESEGIVL